MKQTPRGRISVDVGRLRVALLAQAREQGVSPSHLVRDILVAAINRIGDTSIAETDRPHSAPVFRVRLSLRLSPIDAHLLQRAAHRAGKSRGELVSDLLNGISTLVSGVEREAQRLALVSSTAELSSLARDLRRLTSLLGEGSVAAAQRYRDLLDSVGADVRHHVNLSSAVLADLVPGRRHENTPSSSAMR